MKIQANTIRPGAVLEHEGRQWRVIKINLIQPGKGNAFIAVEMRDIETGTKTNERWRTNDSVEKLDVREIDCQYLFKDESGYHFMEKDTFEQFSLPEDAVGEQGVFLQDGMDVTCDTIEGRPVGVNLPQTVVLEVVEADPVVKGQTASSSYKPGVLENGQRIMIPPHIGAGTKVVVNTEDGSYVERFKG